MDAWTDGQMDAQKRITHYHYIIFLQMCEGEGGKHYEPYKNLPLHFLKDLFGNAPFRIGLSCVIVSYVNVPDVPEFD